MDLFYVKHQEVRRKVEEAPVDVQSQRWCISTLLPGSIQGPLEALPVLPSTVYPFSTMWTVTCPLEKQ